MDPEEYSAYRESFEAFDWNINGRISYTYLQVNMGENIPNWFTILYKKRVTLTTLNNKIWVLKSFLFIKTEMPEILTHPI